MIDLAVRTNASPTAIWVIVIAMVICTAILVAAPAIADSRQARASRRAAGIFALESTSRHEGPDATAEGETGQAPQAGAVPGQREPGAQPAGEAPTRPDMPPVPGRPAMPAQRGGEADQAERSHHATGADDEAPGEQD